MSTLSRIGRSVAGVFQRDRVSPRRTRRSTRLSQHSHSTTRVPTTQTGRQGLSTRARYLFRSIQKSLAMSVNMLLGFIVMRAHLSGRLASEACLKTHKANLVNWECDNLMISHFTLTIMPNYKWKQCLHQMNRIVGRKTASKSCKILNPSCKRVKKISNCDAERWFWGWGSDFVTLLFWIVDPVDLNRFVNFSLFCYPVFWPCLFLWYQACQSHDLQYYYDWLYYYFCCVYLSVCPYKAGQKRTP